MASDLAVRLERAAAPPDPGAEGRALGIGIVGCGAIVQAAHLPAYSKAGFRVVAVADRDADLARATAERFGVPSAYGSADELLADPAVQVVDIAVHPEIQHGIALSALSSGRHLLCQKPLAEDFPAARELVEAAESAGAVLAVNQQMRWEQLVRGIAHLRDSGELGDVVDVFIDIDMRTDFSDWPWIARRSRVELFYHSIHHLDTVRFLLGDPTAVWSSLARHPEQDTPGETRSLTSLEYPGDVRACVRAFHSNWSDSPRAEIHVRGTRGHVDGELGLLYDYPHGRPDLLRFTPRGGEPQEHRYAGSWVPDAFEASMADLLAAVVRGTTPSASGRDNLATLRVVHAAYLSAAEGRRVDPAEIGA